MYSRDVLSQVMGELHMHIREDHGDLLQEWFLHSLSWINVFWIGFRPSQRVKWAGELKNEGAEQFPSHTFIDPESTDLGFLKE
ncbi:unnamed protein product [Sphenostylis stenocarpa]|uniref:Uncharacterized protein n=1 Tax=Sphenostylis stenocarpa TaxID=92480 RepID=A0AA86SPI9_9FABA|nr:unnamed protein product [Sphenostylis stenocarpa]